MIGGWVYLWVYNRRLIYTKGVPGVYKNERMTKQKSPYTLIYKGFLTFIYHFEPILENMDLVWVHFDK